MSILMVCRACGSTIKSAITSARWQTRCTIPQTKSYVPPRRKSCPTKEGWLDSAGSAIHEHGTCRMGDDPKKSALNAFNQMHEVKNVFVVDGSSFTTASEKIRP